MHHLLISPIVESTPQICVYTVETNVHIRLVHIIGGVGEVIVIARVLCGCVEVIDPGAK